MIGEIKYLTSTTDHWPAGETPKAKCDLSALIAGLTALAGDSLLPSMLQTQAPKPERKCLLPGCENLTTHNGGYCCAEHCAGHRKMDKERRKP